MFLHLDFKLLNKFKKCLEALLGINDTDLFKGLKIYKLGIPLSKTPEVFQKRKLRVLTVKSAFLRESSFLHS